MSDNNKRSLGYEIRTLLNNVLGLVDLSLQRTRDEEVREYLHTATHAAKLAMRHVNEFVGAAPENMRNQALELTLSPQSAASKSKEASSGGGLLILLAEDNPINQKIVYKFLSKQSHTVVVVENGQRAIEELSLREFDLMLTDIEMPVIDGRELVRLIREREIKTGKRLPIIALSAVEVDREDAWTKMLDAYVPKPFSLASLGDMICKLASKNRDKF